MNSAYFAGGYTTVALNGIHRLSSTEVNTTIAATLSSSRYDFGGTKNLSYGVYFLGGCTTGSSFVNTIDYLNLIEVRTLISAVLSSSRFGFACATVKG